MKRSFLLFAAAAALCMVSCDKNEGPATTDNVIDFIAPQGTISVGKAVTFNDNSLNVTSRTWTFEDASPATSDKASVDVTFNSAGEKKVTLTVTFTDKFTLSEECTVTVTDPLDGVIAASKLTPKGCIRIGESTKFSLSDVNGSPESYLWTFEGGNPATSTDASPSVVFDKRIRNAKVTCEISRKGDGANQKIEAEFVVGNYPLLHDLPDYDIDNYWYERGKLGGWIAWTEKGSNIGTCGAKNIFSIVEGGANGTGHCMKVDLTKIDAEADGSFADIFPRDAWPCNAHLEAGKQYELSYWIKGDALEGGYIYDNEGQLVEDFKDYVWLTGCLMLVNYLEEWMNVDGQELYAGAAWSTMFPGLEFAMEPNTVFKEMWWDPAIVGMKDGSWRQIVIPFTAPANLHNTYPYFRVYSGHASSVYLDEIEINLIEE
ncbi:MAG: PKD domain-containing protein [Candidatus Cryptobacteroides sp.]